MLLPCLGWTPPGGRPLAFPDFRMRVGTRLQLSDVLSMRAVHLERVVVVSSFPSHDAVPLLWRMRTPLAAALREYCPRALSAAGGEWRCHQRAGGLPALLLRRHAGRPRPSLLGVPGGVGGGGGAHHGPQPVEACRPLSGAALSCAAGAASPKGCASPCGTLFA